MLTDPGYLARLDELGATLGHRFNEPRRLFRALTHRSYVNENAHLGLEHNECLEFVGDSILNFIISTHLFECFPTRNEGDFSRMRSHLVSGEHLEKLARGLNLGNYLLLGRGESKTGGAEKKNILSDAFEAVIAAVYLDGGIRAARAFVLRQFRPVLKALEGVTWEVEDCKSRLQETVTDQKLPLPRYVLVREEGPDHDKRFEVEVWVGDERVGSGNGKSKKEAQQKAARQALEKWRVSRQP